MWPVLGHTMHRAVPDALIDARGTCGDRNDKNQARAPVSPRSFFLNPMSPNNTIDWKSQDLQVVEVDRSSKQISRARPQPEN